MFATKTRKHQKNTHQIHLVGFGDLAFWWQKNNFEIASNPY